MQSTPQFRYQKYNSPAWESSYNQGWLSVKENGQFPLAISSIPPLAALFGSMCYLFLVLKPGPQTSLCQISTRASFTSTLGIIWQCLELFLIVTTRGRYWHLLSRAQQRHLTSYNAQHSPPQ